MKPPALLAGAAVWTAAAVALALLDGRVDLASLALLLVLAAAIAAVWWPPWLAAPACALAVLGFNWFLVPPRYTFDVDLREHALLLVAMLGVGGIVAWLVGRQREAAERARQHAQQADDLHRFGDALRDADPPLARAPLLQAALAERAGVPVHLLVLREALPPVDDDAQAQWTGTPDADQRAGLWLCVRENRALGPGSGRHEDQPCSYLPMRGRTGARGAAVIAWPAQHGAPDALRRHLQGLCDAMGQALERAAALAAADQARAEAQAQALRNTLLSSVAHDFRTPLATILGAATSLRDQGERLGPAPRRRLVDTVVDEAAQLGRIAENTLQLARLEGAQTPTLRLDWESAEEIVGTVLRHARRDAAQQRVRARLEPGLPLLRCDAQLLVQMLDNLVDNALRHGGEAAPVELLVRAAPQAVLFAVRDRGPGVPPAWRERIFERFERGPADPAQPRRGAGLGLALCRAIAQAHGGRLSLRARAHGGASFEFLLPAVAAPQELP